MREEDVLLHEGRHAGDSFYRSLHHMSASSLRSLNDGVARQKMVVDRHRAVSDGNLRSSLIHPLAKQTRRTLYETLPFFAAHGMQHREQQLKKVLSVANVHSLANLIDTGENHILESVDDDELVVTWALVMAVAIAMLTQFLVGYNTGVMNAPESVVFPGHTTTEWSLSVSSFAIGGPFGAMLAGVLANQWGRRATMLTTIWTFLLGGLVLSFSPSINYIIVARVIIGFASGLATVVVPIYLGEIAPPTLRGALGTCTQFALVIGILCSNVLAFGLATAELWRYLFAVTPFIAAVQLVMCLPLPHWNSTASPSTLFVESPRWLLSHDRHSTLARVVIKQLRGYRSDAEVDNEIEHFLCAAEKHKTRRDSAHSSGAMWDLLHAEEMRILVISSIVLQMSQQLCGINAVFYYSTAIFDGLITNPLVGTSLVGLVNVGATYAALAFMDTTPRRTMLLVSSAGMLVSIVVITLALQGIVLKSLAVAAVLFYVSFFEVGLGPIPWLIVAEMFDTKWVSTAMSLACIVNWSCNFLVGFCFPYMQQSMGALSFIPFGVVLLLTLVFTLAILPETQGRSVQDVQRMVGVDTYGSTSFDDENDVHESGTALKHIVHTVDNYDLDAPEL